MTASWRTSLFGAGGLLYLVGTALTAMFDGKPETNPDWNALLVAGSACLGLLFARDNRVSSEKAGAVTPEVKP